MRAILWMLAVLVVWRRVLSLHAGVGEGSDGIGETIPRIAGGGIVRDIKEVPYAVAIRLNRNRASPSEGVLWDLVCGGSILTEFYVLTACQCVAKENAAGGNATVVPLVEEYPVDRWQFVAGAEVLNLSGPVENPRAQVRSPQFIHHHPKCMLEKAAAWLLRNVPVYDAAIAKMAQPFDSQKNLKPVEMTSFFSSQFEGSLDDVIRDLKSKRRRCVFSGWGSTVARAVSEDLQGGNEKTLPNEGPLVLKAVKVQARKADFCLEHVITSIQGAASESKIILSNFEDFKGKFSQKIQNQLCAADKISGPCRGDFGSGLICDLRFIFGITSWTLGCGTPMRVIFQGLITILDWLEEELCHIEGCQDVVRIHPHCTVPLEWKQNCASWFTTTTPSLNTTSKTTLITAVTTSTTTSSDTTPAETPVTEAIAPHDVSRGSVISSCVVAVIPSCFLVIWHP